MKTHVHSLMVLIKGGQGAQGNRAQAVEEYVQTDNLQITGPMAS